MNWSYGEYSVKLQVKLSLFAFSLFVDGCHVDNSLLAEGPDAVRDVMLADFEDADVFAHVEVAVECEQAWIAFLIGRVHLEIVKIIGIVLIFNVLQNWLLFEVPLILSLNYLGVVIAFHQEIILVNQQ